MTRLDWTQEQNDLNELLVSCVGYNFGPRPVERIDDIRKDREEYGAIIASMIGLQRNDVVLDLGSGCGFATRAFAPLVRKVVCADVNRSFLQYCSTELKEFDNIDYHNILFGDLSPLQGYGITKTISTAVFIHFNFYDICIYLSELRRISSDGMTIFFDFLNPEGIENSDTGLFRDHMGIYLDNPASIAKLVQYNSSNAIEQAARLFGFECLQCIKMHGECYGAILQKI